MSRAQQSDLEQYAAETKTESVTRTIKCPLETSDRKLEYLRECIDEWQEIAKFTADRLRSFDRYDVNRNNPQVGRIPREWDKTITAAVAQEAAYKPVEAYQSWYELGQQGKPPIGDFGGGDYLRLRNQQITLEENDQGYGVRLNLVPYDAEWFHIGGGKYQEEWLARILDEDDPTRHGSAEVYLQDDSATLHLSITSEVEVVVPDGVERWLGVDLGENVLYATACVGSRSGDVENVELKSGKEFRHYRERLKEKRAKLGRQGDLRGVKRCKGDIEKYTDQTLHTASKRIVEIASERRPCGIRLEEMGDYRETAPNPIHDWPRGKLVEYITYKATAAGIPVQFVDPSHTSQTCRKCGQTDDAARDGSDFHCRRCGYEVHADVNAAINIAQRSP